MQLHNYIHYMIMQGNIRNCLCQFKIYYFMFFTHYIDIDKLHHTWFQEQNIMATVIKELKWTFFITMAEL